MLSEDINVEGTAVTVKKRLAEGGFGYIDLVTDSRTGAEYCLKRCGIQNSESQHIVDLEINMLRKFRCENIVQIIGSDIKPAGRNRKEAFILLEYCSGGHLLDMLNKRAGRFLPMRTIADIFAQVLKAMQMLHSHKPPVTHRDLKLENILMARNGSVKLCDFGSCVSGNVPLTNSLERSRAEEVINKTTTQAYRAPEMVDLFIREELTEKTDIWALGCILYTLCFISHPFQDAGNLGILSAKVTMPTKNGNDVPETAKTLITRMLDMDPEARPTVDQLITATVALSHGTSLPPFEISDEAKQRRAERESAQQRRRTLQTKKAYNEVPKRAPVQLNPNSAAARRLAAKRGGNAGAAASPSLPSTTVPKPQTSTSSISSSKKDVNFGNFENFDNPSTSNQTESFSSFDVNFDTNFDTDFSNDTNNNSSAHLFSDSDDNAQINSAPLTSEVASDMFFSDPDPAPSSQDDGFGNFDLDNSQQISPPKNIDDGFGNFDLDNSQQISSPPKNIVSPDSFFSSDFEEQQDVQSNVKEKNEHASHFDAGFEFFGDDSGGNGKEVFASNSVEDMFGNVSIQNASSSSVTVDFFSTSSSDSTSDNPFDHHSDSATSNNGNNNNGDQNSFDMFEISDEPPQQESSFQPPQHDPFDMFSANPTNPNNASSSSSANDLFSFTGGISGPDTSAAAPSSKAASVMQMFNDDSAKQVDPFAQVLQQGQGYQQQGHQQGYQQAYQRQQGSYHQQQHHGGYGSYQQQGGGYGGVRQVNPAASTNKDPFGSLMGSLK